MNDKLKVTDLRETLETAEAELVTLQKRVEMLKEWITVTRRLCSKTPKLPANLEGIPTVPRMRRTRTASLASQILEVLQERGTPMHVREIVAALAAKGHAMTAQNQEATVAIALSRRPEQFRRTAPNTFGLVSATPLGGAATIAS
jgi:HB1, ASXL, restriction endonuclease HTH domain